MSMSTHAVGFRPADETWDKMKAAWEACEKAGAKIPQEVLDYFDGEWPGNKPGMEVKLGESCKEYNAFGESGFEIDIEVLPAGVRYIRVYNAA